MFGRSHFLGYFLYNRESKYKRKVCHFKVSAHRISMIDFLNFKSFLKKSQKLFMEKCLTSTFSPLGLLTGLDKISKII